MRLMNKAALYIKKIIYYRDIPLIFNIFISSFFITGKSVDDYLNNVEVVPAVEISVAPQKIIKYVGLCLYIRNKLGLRKNCFLHSMLLYKFLTRYGIKAKINFGIRKEEGEIVGHCWVNADNNSSFIDNGFEIILRHPNA